MNSIASRIFAARPSSAGVRHPPLVRQARSANCQLPTADPSKALFYGGFKPRGYDIGFVFDLEKQQMAPLTASRRYEYFVGSLSAMSVVRNYTLTLIKDLPVGEPVALAQWRTQMEAESAKRDQSERERINELKQRLSSKKLPAVTK